MINGIALTMAQQLAIRAVAYAIQDFPVCRPLTVYERSLGFQITQPV